MTDVGAPLKTRFRNLAQRFFTQQHAELQCQIWQIAFVLHALSCLSRKGRAAIACFPDIFYRSGAEQAIYDGHELNEQTTGNQQLTVQKEGNREVSRTINEVIYLRVDSDKPFAGLSNFKGSQPAQAEAMIAKNYFSEQELREEGGKM